jgi:hypothetical protein
VLVEDHHPELVGVLRHKNFKSFVLHSHSAEESLGLLLSHRTLVTSEPVRCREQAAVHEFAMIDIANATADRDILAVQISWMWSEYELASRQLFIARLSVNRAVLLEPVE